MEEFAYFREEKVFKFQSSGIELETFFSFLNYIYCSCYSSCPHFFPFACLYPGAPTPGNPHTSCPWPWVTQICPSPNPFTFFHPWTANSFNCHLSFFFLASFTISLSSSVITQMSSLYQKNSANLSLLKRVFSVHHLRKLNTCFYFKSKMFIFQHVLSFLM